MEWQEEDEDSSIKSLLHGVEGGLKVPVKLVLVYMSGL